MFFRVNGFQSHAHATPWDCQSARPRNGRETVGINGGSMGWHIFQSHGVYAMDSSSLMDSCRTNVPRGPRGPAVTRPRAPHVRGGQGWSHTLTLHVLYGIYIYIYIYAALTQCRSIWQECLGRQVQSSGLRGSQRSGYSGSKILVTKQTGVRPRGPLGGTAPEIVVPSLSKHPNWSLKT